MSKTVSVDRIIEVGNSRISGGYTAGYIVAIAEHLGIPSKPEGYSLEDAVSILNRIEIGYLPSQFVEGAVQPVTAEMLEQQQ